VYFSEWLYFCFSYAGGLYCVWISALLKEKLLLYGSEKHIFVGLQWSRLEKSGTCYCIPVGSRMETYHQNPSYFCNWSLENRSLEYVTKAMELISVCACEVEKYRILKILIWLFNPWHRHLLCSYFRIVLCISKPKTLIFLSKFVVYSTVTLFG
jgi:hypothetical protein